MKVVIESNANLHQIWIKKGYFKDKIYHEVAQTLNGV